MGPRELGLIVSQLQMRAGSTGPLRCPRALRFPTPQDEPHSPCTPTAPHILQLPSHRGPLHPAKFEVWLWAFGVFLADASAPGSLGLQAHTESGREPGKAAPWLTMLKSRRSLSSLSVPTGAILCGWFILQGLGWAPQA